MIIIITLAFVSYPTPVLCACPRPPRSYGMVTLVKALAAEGWRVVIHARRGCGNIALETPRFNILGDVVRLPFFFPFFFSSFSPWRGGASSSGHGARYRP